MTHQEGGEGVEALNVRGVRVRGRPFLIDADAIGCRGIASSVAIAPPAPELHGRM
jgi:hypothetical protein